MKYGSVRTTKQYNNGDVEVTDLDLVHAGDTVGSYKQFKQRHIVKGSKEETSVYLRFTKDIKDKRDSGKLVILQDDFTTIPSFVIKYPKKDIDGSYVIITSWTEKT